jgi:hypothetical protein
MDKPLVLAVLGGIGIGGLAYVFLLSNGFLALGVGVTYAATIYFHFEFSIGPLEQQVRFGRRRNRLAYGMGIFGTCIGIGGIAELLNSNGSGVLFLWIVGVLAFMVVTLTAYHREVSRDVSY